MNLLELVEDVDYQEKYTYEQRVDLFNKYGYSTATKFFIPIWGLAQFIQELTGIGASYSKGYSEFGHGQSILNSKFSDSVKEKSIEGKVDNRRIRVLNDKRIDIYTRQYDVVEDAKNGNKRRIISFWVESKKLYLNNYGYLNMCSIPRNLYDKIDEWLVDFGYKKWEE